MYIMDFMGFDFTWRYISISRVFRLFTLNEGNLRKFQGFLRILGDFNGIGEISRDFKVCQGKSWYFKQFHGFTRDFTWRYTQVQVYQVYWGFPGNLLDFKEFQGIWGIWGISKGFQNNRYFARYFKVF